MVKKNINIAVICARKNSKRIKNKNFLFIEKKRRVIDFTINAALKSKIFDQIIINTDKKNFYLRNKFNKVKIYQRPSKLGKSRVRVLDVIKEMIKKENISSNANLWALFPTCILRNYKDIRNVYSIYKKHKMSKQVVSMTEYMPAIHVAFDIKKGKLKNAFIKEYNKLPGNHSHKKFYYVNYGIIVMKSKQYIKSKKLINEGSIPYIMPQERSIDIDENFQLELAKKIISYEKI